MFHDNTPSMLFYPMYTQEQKFGDIEDSPMSGTSGYNVSRNFLSPKANPRAHRSPKLRTVQGPSSPVHFPQPYRPRWDALAALVKPPEPETIRLEFADTPNQEKHAHVEAYFQNGSQNTDFVPSKALFRNGIEQSFGTPVEIYEKYDVPTTLMLRNIPNMYTREMIIDEVKQRGLMNDIDFFYVPIDLRHHRSVGYCFINVTSPEAVQRFKSAFDGCKLKKVETAKRCEIGIGKVQGLEANIEAYRNSAIMLMEKKFQPMILQRGQEIPFPPPTLSRKELRLLKREKKGVSLLPSNDKKIFSTQKLQ